MSMAHPLTSPNPSRLLPFSPHNYRALARIDRPNRYLQISASARRNRVPAARAMQPSGVEGSSSSKEGTTDSNNNINPDRSGGAGNRSGGASIPLPNIPTWARWVLGSVVFLALPFYKRILRIEDEAEQDAEMVVKVVEKVAEVVEKVASDVADAVPAGSLNQLALEAEHIAEEVDKDAEQAEAFLHKVDEIKEEVEETLEPIVEKGKHIESESQGKEASPSTDSSKATT